MYVVMLMHQYCYMYHKYILSAKYVIFIIIIGFEMTLILNNNIYIDMITFQNISPAYKKE